MRCSTKSLLCLEIVVCFAPVVLILLLGVLLVPIQFVALNHEPLLWRDSATLLAQVACGGLGLVTLFFMVGSIFFRRQPIASPWLICTGAALGALPIVPYAVYGDTWWWRLVGILPLAATTHILYLGRGILFPSWRHALRSVATATVLVLLLRAIATFDPFHASDRALRAQLAKWEESAPYRYEYTVQLSGWLRPEDLNPKRIVIENGNVVSATYVQDGPSHNPGDAAPLEGLWTIERTFDELLAAEEAGGSVTARFDLRWGFAERAFVEAEGESSGWDVEVTQFSLPREPSK
jgi:uncharacterized protein DUF6174